MQNKLGKWFIPAIALSVSLAVSLPVALAQHIHI
jgi:hypothetical protein